MATVICILGYIFAAILLLAVLLGTWAYIGHCRQLRRMRRQVKEQQLIRFYKGHDHRVGRILKIMRAHVKVRDFYDRCIHIIPIHSIETL